MFTNRDPLMKLAEIELVIHHTYGGFSLDAEIANWLATNRGWKIGTDDQWDDTSFLLIKYGRDHYNVPNGVDEMVIRTHRDVIDCVRELKKLHKDDDWNARRLTHIHRLKVVKVELGIQVVDVHDGIENLSPDFKIIEDDDDDD